MAVLGLAVPVRTRSWPVTHRWAFWSWRRRLIQFGRLEDAGVTLVNVHLTPHGPTSEQDRAAEVDWLLRRLRAVPGPVVVGGDFNAEPGDPLFERLCDAGLRDAWVTARPDDVAGGVTNWSGRRDRPPRRRIDYLWVSAGVEVASIMVPSAASDDLGPFAALSDHLPVTVQLDL
jgi:endonuclease/exonuclease/phosphatase family metal-dependent hydrolase